MKALIDTNIILDFLCEREKFFKRAEIIFRLCEIGKIDGVICAMSIPNIVYILRKELDNEKISEILNILSQIFEISDLKIEDLKNAADLGFKDYEDAIQSACAARVKAEYIITRNPRDFVNSTVKVIEPQDLISSIV